MKAVVVKTAIENAPKILKWVALLIVGLVLVVCVSLGLLVATVAAAVSTGPSMVGVNPGGWTHPVPTTARWDTYGGGSHNFGAIDFPAGFGEQVYAAGSGIVRHAGETGTTYGLAIVIEHPDGTSTMYAHLSRVDTQPGAVVAGGTHIGLVGISGSDAYQPHLHFEVKSGWAVSDRRNQLPTYSYMRQRGVDLGPCFGGPCELAGG